MTEQELLNSCVDKLLSPPKPKVNFDGTINISNQNDIHVPYNLKPLKILKIPMNGVTVFTNQNWYSLCQYYYYSAKSYIINLITRKEKENVRKQKQQRKCCNSQTIARRRKGVCS